MKSVSMDDAMDRLGGANSITIHCVGPADAALLDDVAPDLFADRLDPERVEQYLAQPNTLLVVARDGATVVGQACGAINHHPDKPADLYLDELIVAQTHQRRGIGRRLVREVERWAKDRGCNDVWLAARTDNVAARTLYDGLGDSVPAVLYYWDL